MQLLTASGFSKSDDGQRLLFDTQQLYYLKIVNNALLQNVSQHKKSHTKISNNAHNIEHKTYNHYNVNSIHQQMDETKESYQVTVKELIDAGFSLDEAETAIKQSQQDEKDDNQLSEDAFNTLVSMGFDKATSIFALLVTDNDVSAAVRYLLNNPSLKSDFMSLLNCNGDITNCVQMKKLREIMIDYDKSTDNDGSFCNKYSNDIIKILDYFQHFLSIHNKDIKQFHRVYQSFGGKCNAEKCVKIRRHYRERKCTESKANEDDNDRSNICKHNIIQEFLDIIHCHIRHGYDIGARLTEREQNINVIDDDEKYDGNDKHKADEKTKGRQLIKLRTILDGKRLKFEKFCKYQRYSKDNKFSTNLNQIDIDKNDQHSSIQQYSFSLPFTYTERCKNSNKRFHGDLSYSDLYIPAKHASLKDELVNNKIVAIDIKSWNEQMDKAMHLKETVNGRRSWAKVSKWMCGKWGKGDTYLNHPVHIGYIDGSPITEHHVIVLLMYCSFDNFQRKFTETYRKQNYDDKLGDVIKRHSNYHHFAKYLQEAVLVFGIIYTNGDIYRMYHGINKEMTFPSMSEAIYSPLSTTTEWNVAVQFSCKTGLVVEMVPNAWVKYFSCDWISPFPYEAEILFVNTFFNMHFLNVLNSEFGWDFQQYIIALRIIDSVTMGYFAMYDPADFHKLSKNFKIRNVSLLKLSHINTFQKKLCLALLYHELNRNGFHSRKYVQIDEIPHLNEYIDQLLHQVCQNKRQVTIEWETMIVNILKKVCVGDGGYIGYSFLKPLFCSNEYEGVNLDVLCALFPNLRQVTVRSLSSISSCFLDDIAEFLTNNMNHTLYQISLDVPKEFGRSNILEQCANYTKTFTAIGYKINAIIDCEYLYWGNRIIIAKNIRL